MAEELFTNEFVSGLPDLNRFYNPMVVRLCKDTMPSNIKLRSTVEQWFAKLEKEAQNAIRTRLRNVDDDVFLAAFFELALKEHFEESDFEVEFEPILDDDTTPDFKLTANGNEAYIEVRTIMEAEEEQLNRKRKNDALIQIDKIASKYLLSIHFEEDPKEGTKPTALKGEIEKWLNGVSIPEHKSERRSFSAGGYVVEVRAYHESGYGEGTQRIRFNGGPVKFLGTSLRLMHRGIKKKSAKYKSLQRQGKPYVVAICSTDLNFVLEDMWMTLAAYGSLQGEANDRGSFSLSGKKPKNSGVSGVLHCKLLQDKDNFGFEINFYENPFARTKMPEEFGWRNSDSTKQDQERKGWLPLLCVFVVGCLLFVRSLFRRQ